MPKMKTHSSSKKRFRATGSGKISYQKNGRRHLLVSMSSKRRRSLRQKGIVDHALEARMKVLLPYL